MSTVPEQIAQRFLEELSKSEALTEDQVEALRKLMSKPAKLKAADVENILSPPEEDTL